MSPSLQLISVSKTFPSGSTERNIYKRLLLPQKRTPRKVIFENLNLSIGSGEVVALVGPNGTGKTTILKLIAGLAFADRGSITIEGKPHYRFDRGRIGVVFSNDMLYSGLTGFQNLEYSAHLFRCENPQHAVNEAIDEWGMRSYIDLTVSGYSAGMRSRLALARGTLHRPTLLLLDEPTVFLDVDGLERLHQNLRRSRATAIVRTHQPDLLATDRVVEIGQLCARDN